RGDVVARAIEALNDETRRTNATVLALHGSLQAIAGKFARAESLLRRSLARAGNDRELIATASLRLASVVANQGGNAAELLRVVGDDPEQSSAHRAEALSLIAGQRAVAGDFMEARAAVSRLEAILDDVDSDAVRAKALHYVGIAFHHLGEAERASTVLTQSADLAAELHLYGVASRANAVLSNLVLHEEDDVDGQLRYAELAASTATKAGDTFALQTALLQMLSARMRQGDVERSIAVEERLVAMRTAELGLRYLTLFRAVRLAWEGRFGEAQRLVSSCWSHMPFDFDRLLTGGEYALFLAIDGQREPSIELSTEILSALESAEVTGLFRVRSLATARALCALTEAINGRMTLSERALRGVHIGDDKVIALTVRTVESIVWRLRNRGESAADKVAEGVEGLRKLDYADVARMLSAVDRVLCNSYPELTGSINLTDSEIDVLRLLAEGLIPKEIAARDGRSVYTIRAHIANAIAKLECHGRFEAIREARRLGLI
ncbi:MAG: LuxR C-terminal-related transcriptional regulator, partial [Candidatus Baltobacteraceae bacterium]